MKFRFLSFGRNNERSRLAWLERHLNSLPPGTKILDAGAGELRNKKFCAHLNYVSQDFCQYEGRGDGVAIQTGKWNTDSVDLVSDITSIPAHDSSFDVVLCTEVLEHVPDSLAALRELTRLVRPGGQLIITVPFCSLTHFAPFHYATGLSKYWFFKHLNELDFTIVEASPNGGWLDFIAQELWRLPWVGRTYSSWALGWVALLVGLPVLAVMRLMKCYDSGSDELLTFGWQIVALKSQ